MSISEREPAPDEYLPSWYAKLHEEVKKQMFFGNEERTSYSQGDRQRHTFYLPHETALMQFVTILKKTKVGEIYHTKIRVSLPCGADRSGNIARPPLTPVQPLWELMFIKTPYDPLPSLPLDEKKATAPEDQTAEEIVREIKRGSIVLRNLVLGTLLAVGVTGYYQNTASAPEKATRSSDENAEKETKKTEPGAAFTNVSGVDANQFFAK